MQNNQLGNIAVSNSKSPRALFNLSSDLHTTMDFGSVVPGRVQMMIPNSQVVASSREKIWCAPLLAPTMGRLSLKVYHNFVRLSDLTENFAPMLSGEAVSRGSQQFVPQNVPSITLRALSFFILFGSYLNVYKSTGDDSTDLNTLSLDVYNGNSGILASDADLSNLGLLTKSSYASIGLNSCFQLNTNLFFPNTSTSGHFIPLSNPENATFYSIDPSCTYFLNNSEFFDLTDVTPQSADVVIPLSLNNSNYYLAFRLSDYGKRLRKILIGCGYQIDFTSDQVVSLLPLFAFFKSYFDVFGLTLYQNWEQTFSYRFMRFSDLSPSPAIGNFWDTSWTIGNNSTLGSLFFNFVVRELATTFYTDEQDFVSAHTRKNAVSPSPNDFIQSINTDLDGSKGYKPNINVQTTNPNEPSGVTTPNGHAFIYDVLHGQMDSELLKRLYRWTNRNTIAGRRIAELLRAQGLGSYVDECKSDFIGYFELPIDIFDGISQSDTFSQAADSGAPLGERFGTADAASSKHPDCERNFKFECNEFGYWITLFAIVPKGGYAEALDPTALATSKFEFYHRDFDSLGMEFSPKSLVVGSQPFADFQSSSGTLKDSFGLVPRYFRWKFGHNVANGDFTRRGSRSSFAPYYLDKIIAVGDRYVSPVQDFTTYKTYGIIKYFKAADLPIAGNVYRYPTRYPFIGSFDRIFNLSGTKLRWEPGNYAGVSVIGAQVEFEFFSQSEDNFIVSAVFNVQYRAPMLPVEDSFETYDDDNAVNGSMDKA